MSDQDDGGGGVGVNCGAPGTQMTPRSSLGSGAGFSSSSISPSTSSGSINSKAALSECLGAWLNYLNSLNNLCASGYRLSQTIANLDQWLYVEQPVPPVNAAPQSAWDDLARASAVATSTVKTHVVAVLQEYVTQPLSTMDPENEVPRVREHNQAILTEVGQTMINLQHQFCVASYDSFAHLLFAQQQQQQMQMLEANEGYPPLHGRSRTTSPHFQGPPGHHHHSTPPSNAHRSMYGSDHSNASIGGGLEQNPPAHQQQPQPRSASPHQDIRGPSPIQGFLDNCRGPLPNPGHLLGMKAPFYRGSRSPLNFPLFPLAGQRRWSEAAAGEVCSGDSVLDAESQMRRWSMPWEATKTERNWQQTRNMPVSKLAVPLPPSGVYCQVANNSGMHGGPPHTTSRSCSDRSQSTTPDWQSSITSQDGLAEAIQLLSCKPASRYSGGQQHVMGAPFIEEPPSTVTAIEIRVVLQSINDVFVLSG